MSESHLLILIWIRSFFYFWVSKAVHALNPSRGKRFKHEMYPTQQNFKVYKITESSFPLGTANPQAQATVKSTANKRI